MDQAVRNKLRNVVTKCRKLLEESMTQTLQGRFGIYDLNKKGEIEVEGEARMAHLGQEELDCRQDLLDHLEHIQSTGHKPSEALDQLIREISFTHLNRLCAYKMMESRGLIREAVSRGLKSQGFFFYLADHLEAEKLYKSGQKDLAYLNFLNWLGRKHSQEIGVLFSSNDSANRIYPPQRVLDEVLFLINDGELNSIWSQDETIGWVYQYFTPKELRDKARKESQAPRNSYELAFRNQFFTPRYVVEFLTDNTLGRIWYEMRKGKTVLKDRCNYLVRRSKEIFLKEDEQLPPESNEARGDLSQEELLKQPIYVPHRPKKDPRELKVLDPACGSGHFLLYCFDLLQIIYEEAYDDPDLSAALKADYPVMDDLSRAVPGLILKHNLHGIDIDLRATQIAALALWLRCQRAYQELGLKNWERPKITRSNIVCAEPMPGEGDMLKEFTATLQPKVLGQLVETVFEMMKLAGEAGSLLKIEEEIREVASKAKFEFIQWKKHQDKAKWSLFPELVERDQLSIFDFADMNDEAFLDRVEEEIVAALQKYAEKASNGKGFRRRLFAEDAARGFSFVDVCSKRYDVVLMNPPFGAEPTVCSSMIERFWARGKHDLSTAFVELATNTIIATGMIGAIMTRTPFFLSRFHDWRVGSLYQSEKVLNVFADLGMGVLDTALVEASLVIIGSKYFTPLSFDLRNIPEKSNHLLRSKAPCYVTNLPALQKVPNAPLAYWIPYSILSKFEHFGLYGRMAEVKQGLATKDNVRFVRTWWEVSNQTLFPFGTWRVYAKGGMYARHYLSLPLVVDWSSTALEEYKTRKGQMVVLLTTKCKQYLPKRGITYSKRSQIGFSARVMQAETVFSPNGPGIFPKNENHLLYDLAFLNSRFVSSCLDFMTSFGSFSEGYVKSVPYPKHRQELYDSIKDLERDCIINRRAITVVQETSREFNGLTIDEATSLSEYKCKCQEKLNSSLGIVEINEQKLDAYFRKVFELTGEDQVLLASQSGQKIIGLTKDAENTGNDETEDDLNVVNAFTTSQEAISFCVGATYGRWDIRIATGERQPPELPDPFDPLPVCPPGMLQGPNGLPAKPEDVPSDYPIRINWDGILVDDPGHEDDIVRRVRDVLEVIWKDRAESIEKEACEILGVRELRDYFRKPGNSGFWMDHVKRYSKSRRKAPIYWYLRSARGNYGFWLYYHQLDKDTLFKALYKYVEPKIRLEEDHLQTLRFKREEMGGSGRQARQIEKEIDRQEQFVSELKDFEEKLRRAANLNLDFDLNDGVILNIAPLWELIPWKEPKKYWDALKEESYDWSHIAYQLWPEWVEEACRRDRSIAIAHEREDLYNLKASSSGKRERVKK